MGAWRLWAEFAGEIGAPLYTVIGFTLGYAAAFGTLSATSLGTALIVGLLIRETVGRDEQRDAESAALLAAQAGADGRVTSPLETAGTTPRR